jgi:hypothetical protein
VRCIFVTRVHAFRTLVALALCAGGVGTTLFASSAEAAQSGLVFGSVTSLEAGQLTIQTPGRAVGVLNALTTAATRIEGQNLPYVWGGGHGEAGVASKGERGGSGFNGRRIGYDCSGAVAAVLVAGGLWPQGGGVPNDWGVIRYLLAQRLIAPGAGTGPTEVTLYDDPGVHIFMNIDGRFWGTSDGAAGGDSKGGPGWLDDGAWDITNKHFRRYHFVASVLKAKTTAGYSLTFDLGPQTESLPGLVAGMKVGISYATSKYGTMVANTVNYKAPATSTPKPTPTPTPTPTPATTPQSTVAGAVTAIASDDSSFTIESSAGVPMTFEVTSGSTVAQQFAAGQIAVNAVVIVVYTNTPTPTSTTTGSTTVAPPATTLTAVSVKVNAPPPPTGAASIR